MQPELPLEGLPSLLPTSLPFTPAQARAVGVGRPALARMLRHGVIRKVVKGVYVDAAAPDSSELRAHALGLVVPASRVVHGRTASWLYGVPVTSGGGRVETTSRPGLPGSDLRQVDGLTATTPVRTALDLGRTLSPDRAIAAIDRFLHTGLVAHGQLLAELPRFGRHPGIRQLRELVARADGRASSAAESVLRMRWLDAHLPTPVPRLHRGDSWLELALPVRRFGAVLTGRLAPVELAGWARAGWHVVVLHPGRVLGSDPTFVSGHLEREFRQHLLQQAG